MSANALPPWPQEPNPQEFSFAIESYRNAMSDWRVARCEYWESRCRFLAEQLSHISDGRTNLPRVHAIRSIIAIGELPPDRREQQYTIPLSNITIKETKK